MTDFDDSVRAVTNAGGATSWFEFRAVAPLRTLAAADDVVAALWAAELCRLSYRDVRHGPRTRGVIAAEAGVHERRFFTQGFVEACVFEPENGSWRAVVFRGSAEPRDWFHNVQILLAPAPCGGRAHKGFLDARPAIRELLAAADVDDTPLVLAGHSLGGALAMLAAAERPRALAAAFAFGAPKPGDAEFAARTRDLPIVRFVNHRDWIPTLPPSTSFLPFAPAGALRYFAHDGALLVGPDDARVAQERARPSARRRTPWFARALTGKLRPAAADHAPVNYVAQLERAAEVGFRARSASGIMDRDV